MVGGLGSSPGALVLGGLLCPGIWIAGLHLNTYLNRMPGIPGALLVLLFVTLIFCGPLSAAASTGWNWGLRQGTVASGAALWGASLALTGCWITLIFAAGLIGGFSYRIKVGSIESLEPSPLLVPAVLGTVCLTRFGLGIAQRLAARRQGRHLVGTF